MQQWKVSEHISYSSDSSSLIEAIKFWKHCFGLPGILHCDPISSGLLTSVVTAVCLLQRMRKGSQNKTPCNINGTFLVALGIFYFILRGTNWYSIHTTLADGDAESKAWFLKFPANHLLIPHPSRPHTHHVWQNAGCPGFRRDIQWRSGFSPGTLITQIHPVFHSLKAFSLEEFNYASKK